MNSKIIVVIVICDISVNILNNYIPNLNISILYT